MSAGRFTRSKYQADDGTILSIRVQPETLTASLGATNSAPTGSVDGLGSAKARGGRREIGVKARRVSVAFTGSPPTDYAENTVLQIPVLTLATYNATAIGSTGTYLGSPVTVVGKTAESVR